MPDRSEKVLRLYDEVGEYELPYISKSRVKQWLENPEHFRLKYLEGIEEPETGPMVRGSRIHETFEYYYGDVIADLRGGGSFTPEGGLSHRLPTDRELWADFVAPYVANFLVWEVGRWQESGRDPEKYLPRGVEEEHWRDPILGIPGEPEWMGLADVILPAASLPEVEADEGDVIVDFKTGSVPDEQYRSPGIYTELEYYVMLFEDQYDVVGAGAYYPREDEFIAQPETESFRGDVIDAAREMVQATESYEGDEQFEINPGPLCKWGTGEDEESSFYGVCSQCSWGAPAKRENEFKELVAQGYNAYEIAEHLGCETDAVYYWKHKFDL